MKIITNQDVANITRILAEICYMKISTNPDDVEYRDLMSREFKLFDLYKLLMSYSGQQVPEQIPRSDFLRVFANIDFRGAVNYVNTHLDKEWRETIVRLSVEMMRHMVHNSPFSGLRCVRDEDQECLDSVMNELRVSASDVFPNNVFLD